MYCITAACGCNVGKVRRNNEDNFYFDGHFLPKENSGLENINYYKGALDQPIFFGVFDGMGGEANGEEAAYLAAKMMWKQVRAPGELPKVLLDICTGANQKICQAAREHGIGIMGSTAVLLGLEGKVAYLVNIGDSRAYLYRDGVLIQMSKDHTDQFIFAPSDMPRRKARLTQYLGIEPEDMVIEPYAAQFEIRSGDMLLMCSDGLTDMVDEDNIKKILQNEVEAGKSVEALINRALAQGGKDNTTAIIVGVSPTY